MTPTGSKVMDMAGAVETFIPDGSSVALGLALEASIPFALGHRLIKAKRANLTLIGPISDVLFDQLILGGCVKSIRAAWVGNVATGLGYNFRRAVEEGLVEMIDYSNFTLSTALSAAAQGLPSGLTTSLLGGDISRNNPDIKPTACPFTGRPLNAVRALAPDVAVVHVQRADEKGNAHLWGPLGVIPEAVRAAKTTIVICEELVSTEMIRSDPNRTVIPGFLVGAVVEQPFGAHPSGVVGCYGHDDDFYTAYAQATKTVEAAARWKADWLDAPADWAAYLSLLGPDRLAGLKIKRTAPAEPVDYGY